MLDIELAPTALYGIILGGLKDLKGRILISVLLLRWPLCRLVVIAEPSRVRLVVQLINVDVRGINPFRFTELTDYSLLIFNVLHQLQKLDGLHIESSPLLLDLQGLKLDMACGSKREGLQLAR